MEKELVLLNNYGLFTFNTTSQALKAEKIFKERNEEILVIPTLREISASCGLSVKVPLSEWERLYMVLREEKVSIEGVYEVEKRKGRNVVKQLGLDETTTG